MRSIQEQISGAILNMIRTRRTASSASESKSHASSSTPKEIGPAKVREAQFSDFQAVSELKQRWGIDADSMENWERLWLRNPVLAEDTERRPIGWVLEAGGAIVGFLGSIPMLYRFGDRPLIAVSSHGLVVEPGYRAAAVSLVANFYCQKSVDLYLVTSAMPEVGRIAKAFKSDALPQEDYDTVLFWVLRPKYFAQTVMEKLQLRSAWAGMGRASASLAIGIDKLFHRRWPKHHSTRLGFGKISVNEISVSEIGDEFQSLWSEKLTEGTRLIADRSPAALRWHFEVPGDRGSARVFCCRRNSELVGYAIVRNDPQPGGLQKSVVADMLVKKDDPEVVRALFIAAYDHAKRGGSYILEVLGFPPSLRQVFLQGNPYRRKYPACPFYYKAADPLFHESLSDGMAWYASPFDGDTTLIRPSYSGEYKSAEIYKDCVQLV